MHTRHKRIIAASEAVCVSHDIDLATVTIDADGTHEKIEVPLGFLTRLAEASESPAEVIGDVVVMALTGRAHHLTHHGDGPPDDELEAMEEFFLGRFEDRFGVTYAEATGHAH